MQEITRYSEIPPHARRRGAREHLGDAVVRNTSACAEKSPPL